MNEFQNNPQINPEEKNTSAQNTQPSAPSEVQAAGQIKSVQPVQASKPEQKVDFNKAFDAPKAQPTYTQPAYSGQQNAYGAQQQNRNPYSGAAQVSWNTPQSNYAPAPPQAPAQPKKKSKAPLAIILIIAIFITSICGGFIGSGISKKLGGGTGNAVVYQSDTKTNSNTDSTGTKTSANTVESVAKNSAASVVEVTTSYVQKGSFFGDYVTSGAGSGVIISKDGYIVTNNHVINDAEEIKVTLKSGKEYTAKLVGTDEKTDIAVLKIDAKDLTPATFGDSAALAAGETIVVVGNPLGSLGGSVTSGIVSATDREIEIDKQTMNLIQVDAAVNPGNSGGALFNLNGELVGIVNAKYSSEEVEGLGFAIPINTAKSTIEDIIEYGYVKGRAQLGITAVEISDLQQALSAGVTELGVYVYSVNDGSGADKAGLKRGDRLISIDGKEVSSYSILSKILDKHSVGDSVKVVYSRNGEQKTVNVKLIEYKPTNNNNNSSN